MKRVVKLAVCAFVAASAAASFAAQKFEAVPEQAMTALKGSRGKLFSSGVVFVNGAYVKPPYRVARYGTAIFVNDVQMTGQIVSWRSFLATQDGYVPPAKPSAAPKKEEKKGSDDLFDDAPEPEKADAGSKDPGAGIVFSANVKSDRILKRINDYRLDVQRKLKEGNICFYGTRYARVVVEPRIAKGLLAVLPEAMRDASDALALESTMRAKGFPFMVRELCEDLLEHRADYPALVERRTKFQEEENLQKMFKNAAGGGL